MVWMTRIVEWLPLAITAFILIWLLCINLKKGEIADKTSRRFLLLILLIYFLQIIAQLVWVYFSMKKSPLGQYLLPGQGTNYFYWLVWDVVQPRLWALVIGLSVVLFLWLGKKLLKAPIVNRADIFVIILTCLVVGPSNIMILLLISFILMIIFQLVVGFRKKIKIKELRVEISPFLLITAFVILVLNNFDFYQNFLSFLRLL